MSIVFCQKHNNVLFTTHNFLFFSFVFALFPVLSSQLLYDNHFLVYVFYNENDIEKSVLDFVNKYSTLGLINNLPLNKYFVLDNRIVLKDYNYIGNSDLPTVVDKKNISNYSFLLVMIVRLKN